MINGRILPASDNEVRVVEHPDGTITMGALTKTGLVELTLLVEYGVFGGDVAELLQVWRLYDGDVYMVKLRRL